LCRTLALGSDYCGLMEDFEAAWRLINEWGDNKDRRIHDNSNSQ